MRDLLEKEEKAVDERQEAVGKGKEEKTVDESQKVSEKEGTLVNEMRLCFLSKGENESLARLAVAGLTAPYDPTMDVLDDIRTAVSEAVTNAIIHGYEGMEDGIVYVSALLYRREDQSCLLQVDVEDTGVGIENVEKAMEPLYTTAANGERAGMGFAFMEAFTDRLEVKSELRKGTCVSMWKELTGPEASTYEG